MILTAIYWITVTHLQGRFFTPALAPAVMAVALIDVKFLRVGVVFAIALSLIDLAILHPRLMHYVAINQSLEARGGSMLGLENLDGLTPFDPATAPLDVHLHLVGDARAFLYQVPMSRLDYRTVFDVDSDDAIPSIATDWLGRAIPSGAGDLTLVDLGELARFHRTYYQIPLLTHEQVQTLITTPHVRVSGQ